METKFKNLVEIVLGSNETLKRFCELYLENVQIARRSPHKGGKVVT